MTDTSAPPRIAVVTGASSGVGAATARAFGALGWTVAIGARRVPQLEAIAGDIRSAGGNAFVHGLDVGDASSIDEFFAAAEAAVGAPDVVVSNAGMGVPGPLHEIQVEDIRREITVNLLGTMFVVRRALPAMIAARRGDLVLISSSAAHEPRSFQAGYAAAKAGIEGLAQGLRRDLEGTGVRTTVVRLGPTRSEFGLGWDSEMLARVIERWQREGFLRHMELMEPEEVAAVVVHAVTMPRGFGTDLIQLNPDGSTRLARAFGESE